MNNSTPVIWRLSKLPTSAALVTAGFSSAVYATFLLSGNLRTLFGPIDDHEPLSWLNGSRQLPLAQSIQILIERTEIGDFGQSDRFRPAYYIVRVGQAVMFGDDPSLWYGFTFALFAATIAILGLVSWLWVSVGIGRTHQSFQLALAVAVPLVGVLIFGSLRAWTGVIARLGPSELLAMLGVSLVLLACTLLVVRQSSWWWLPAILGTFLAVGSKENFVPIALLPLGVGFFRLTRTRSAVNLIPMSAALLTALVVILGLARIAGPQGTDVYGRSVGIGRAVDALTALFGTYALFWIPGAFILVGSVALWVGVRPRPSRDLQALVILSVAAAFLWLLFDAWTYRGVYEMIRYWMVFDFLKALGIIASIALSLGVLARRGGLLGRGLGGFMLIGALALAALQVMAVPQFTVSMRQEVRANAVAASMWNEGVASVIREARKLSRPQIVVLPRGSIDFEPVIALAGALKHPLEHPSVFVRVEPGAAAKPQGGPPIQILEREGWDYPDIQPLADFDPRGEVVCVFLNAEPRPTPGCSPQRTVTVRARGI